ncbi:MAG: DUF2490 domain-containing protein [Bacteroidota bacterium]
MKNRYLAVISAIAFVSGELHAQVYPDAGLWSTFSLEYRFNTRFSVVLDEEFRLKENFSQVNLFYTNLGAAYQPADFLKLAFTYRNVQKFREDKSVSFRNRLMFDIILRYKFKPLAASFRTRFQGELADFYTSPNGRVPEYYMRNKLEVKYDSERRLVPYISAEFRYQIRQRRAPETDGLYHRARPAAGFDYKLNEHNSFGLYYLAQLEWNVSEPERLYIIGIQYNLTL